jgi:putative holliday junction resolvase
LGNLPSFIQRSSKCGSIPSKPRMTIFCLNVDAPRGEVPEQAIDRAAIDSAAATSIRTDLRMGTARIITSRHTDLYTGPQWYSEPVRALGVDYGAKRIGLALSDATGLLASPWKRLPNDGNVQGAAKRLAEEVRGLQADETGLVAIVIGFPRRLNGEPNEQTAQVQKFAQVLGAEVSVPIALQDERLTSHEADALLAQRERNWKRRKEQVDAMAAALILQDYLDSRSRP